MVFKEKLAFSICFYQNVIKLLRNSSN